MIWFGPTVPIRLGMDWQNAVPRDWRWSKPMARQLLHAENHRKNFIAKRTAPI